MKKDFFGRWKKEAATDYDDDQQHLEGNIILERMTSIISSDDSEKEESRNDFKISPEVSINHTHVVSDKSGIRTSERTLDLETSKDYFCTSDDTETKELPLNADGTMASEITIASQDFAMEPMTADSVTIHPTCIENKDAPVILVVDDEPVTQRLLKKILQDRGYGVVIAGDGIDALMELGKGNFDLILSDLSMPNLDGFKLLDFINLKGIQSPVIFLTGSDDVEDEIKVLALGAKDYIRKPINKDLLLLRISKALNN